MFGKIKVITSQYPHLIHSLFLCAVILGLYVKATGHDFLLNWDDGLYITGNQDIMGFTPQNLKNIFTKIYVANYAPLHMFSYMLDYSIWGLSPAGFLMTNILLHVGCTLLFYRLLIRFGLTPLQSLFAALLFAVHPVQVESVAWAAQRKNPLSLLFFLAAWHLWIQWRANEERCRKTAYAFSLLLFTIALLAKSIAVILPLFLLAQDLVLDRKKMSVRLILDKLPYILLAGVCFAMALFSQSQGFGRVGYLGGSFGITMMNMLPVFSRYLTMLIFPFDLSIIYNSAIKFVPDAGTYLGAVVLVLFIIGWIRLYRPHPRHFFFLTLFIVGLLPVSNIIPIVTMMNDRYLYYPMLGMAPFAVLSIQAAIERIPLPYRAVSYGLPALILSAFIVASFFRIDVWKNSLTLWPDTIAKSEAGSWYAQDVNFLYGAYADSLAKHARKSYDAGDVKQAKYHYLLALNYDPGCYQALIEYSKLLMLDGKPLQVRQYLLRLVNEFSRTDDGQYILGVNYNMTGEHQKADYHFRKSLAINPRNDQARTLLLENEQVMRTSVERGDTGVQKPASSPK